MAEGDRGTFGVGRGLAEERIARGPGGVFRMREIVRGTGGSEFITPGGRHRGDEVALGRLIGRQPGSECGTVGLRGKGRENLRQAEREAQGAGPAREGAATTL